MNYLLLAVVVSLLTGCASVDTYVHPVTHEVTKCTSPGASWWWLVFPGFSPDGYRYTACAWGATSSGAEYKGTEVK